jgi:hypothetical protein
MTVNQRCGVVTIVQDVEGPDEEQVPQQLLLQDDEFSNLRVRPRRSGRSNSRSPSPKKFKK